MAMKEVDQQGRLPTTWPGAVARALEIAAGSSRGLVSVVIVLGLLVLLAWLIASVGYTETLTHV